MVGEQESHVMTSTCLADPTGTSTAELEMLIKPFSDAHILEVSTKGTIRNKESVNRSNFRFLREATEEGLTEVIDGIVLEFAEHYAASN